MDLADEIGQPRVANRSFRRWPRSPRVEPGLRDVEDSARELRGETLGDHHVDGREPPFGPTSSLSSSVARRCTASSASSSRMRLRAATSSAFSRRRHPRFEPSVDAVLTSPRVDRLVADPEVVSNLGDLASRVDQDRVLDAGTPADNRAFPCCPPLRTAASHSSNPTPRNPGQTTLILERMEPWQGVGIRRSCVSGRCGWCWSISTSIRRSGRRSCSIGEQVRDDIARRCGVWVRQVEVDDGSVRPGDSRPMSGSDQGARA